MTSTAAATVAAARAEDLSKIYGTGAMAVTALQNVTVAFPQGEFTAIMGPPARASRRSCIAWPDWTR